MKDQNNQAAKAPVKNKGEEKKTESGKPLDVLMHLSGFGVIGEIASIAETTSEAAAGQSGEVKAIKPEDQIKPSKAFRAR
jgi:hypothetical protein